MDEQYSLGKALGLMGIGVGVFAISVLLHNLVYAFFDVEEFFFLCVAVFLAPPAFLLGLIGAVYILIQRRIRD
jgi:hypothetical protein